MATEKRLIDANAFRDYWNKNYRHQYANDTFLFAIANFPTVDAVEVVHGRWLPVDHDGSWRVDMCSICQRRMHYVDYDQPYQYCPNCGADMRERKDND